MKDLEHACTFHSLHATLAHSIEKLFYFGHLFQKQPIQVVTDLFIAYRNGLVSFFDKKTYVYSYYISAFKSNKRFSAIYIFEYTILKQFYLKCL